MIIAALCVVVSVVLLVPRVCGAGVWCLVVFEAIPAEDVGDLLVDGAILCGGEFS